MFVNYLVNGQWFAVPGTKCKIKHLQSATNEDEGVFFFSEGGTLLSRETFWGKEGCVRIGTVMANIFAICEGVGYRKTILPCGKQGLLRLKNQASQETLGLVKTNETLVPFSIW